MDIFQTVLIINFWRKQDKKMKLAELGSDCTKGIQVQYYKGNNTATVKIKQPQMKQTSKILVILFNRQTNTVLYI